MTIEQIANKNNNKTIEWSANRISLIITINEWTQAHVIDKKNGTFDLWIYKWDRTDTVYYGLSGVKTLNRIPKY